MNINEMFSNTFVVAIVKKLRKEIDEKFEESLRFSADLAVPSTIIEGKQGNAGADGKDGKDGINGIDGVKGDNGAKGAPGLLGEQGLMGIQGEKGDTEEKGDKGDTGEQGIQGIQGDRGFTGSVGFTGKSGEKGDTGEKGATGIQGKNGVDGNNGDDGKDGKSGADGKNGKSGPKGSTGQKGLDGKTPSIKHLDKNWKDKNKEIDKSVSVFSKNMENQFNELSKLNGINFDGLKKEVNAVVIHGVNDYKNKLTKANAQNIGGGGGGSYAIMDNRDVEMKPRNLLTGDSILIYNADKKKFVSEDFNAILDRLKGDLEAQTNRLVDKDGDFTYIGEVIPGSGGVSDAVWRIKRLDEKTGVDADDLDVIWADNDTAFVKIWDDRATYNYVPA
jgi:hypothetical protein